ncbi:MAG TPA: hypothetical protein VIP28_15270 [Nocardioides sp.]
MLTQTPSPLPDAGALKDLDPTVALALIIAGVVLALLTYFGGPIRDRLTKKPPPPTSSPPVTDTATSLQLTAQAGSPTVDRAERRTDQFIDNLLRQIEESGAREDQLEQRIESLERRLRDVESENQRLQLMLWQRGPR